MMKVIIANIKMTATLIVLKAISIIQRICTFIIQTSGMRRIHVIRLFGGFMVAWQVSAGVSEAGSRYSREASEIDQSLIVKTIIGLSETQCILKCRRNADCKNSLYEKGGDAKTSYCHFLKDTGGSGINSINSINGIVHEKIVLIGMLFKI